MKPGYRLRLGHAWAGGLLGVLLMLWAAIVASASAQEDGSGATAGGIVVSVSLGEVSTLTGEAFTFTSVIANNGAAATPPLIASLNFTSLDSNTYVDPEDWSPERTQTVAPIAPGASATQTWRINPILEGEIAAYIVALPNPPGPASGALIASPAIHLHVGAQRSLNPGGVLPVVIAVPGLLAIAFAGLRATRIRRRF